MSEIHAAVGLSVLEHADAILKKRKEIAKAYDKKIKANKKIRPALRLREGVDWNAAYYPVLLDSEKLLNETVGRLEGQSIGTRRYFYPELSQCLGVNSYGALPMATDISSRIIVLPMFHEMKKDEIDRVSCAFCYL